MIRTVEEVVLKCTVSAQEGNYLLLIIKINYSQLIKTFDKYIFIWSMHLLSHHLLTLFFTY